MFENNAAEATVIPFWCEAHEDAHVGGEEKFVTGWKNTNFTQK
jgi:hypothetical protein